MIHQGSQPIIDVAYYFTHMPVMVGWVQALLAAAPLISKLFGDTSKSRAEARVAETALNTQQDTANINRAVVDNNLTQSKQDAAYKNGIRAGLQDFHITRPSGVPDGRATGGLRPSAILNGNKLGKEFQASNLESLREGTPRLTPPPQAGKFDKFLNMVGGGSGLLGFALNAMGDAGKQSTPIPNTSNPKVSTNPMAPLSFTESIGNAAVTPPQQSTYRPKFTPRF